MKTKLRCLAVVLPVLLAAQGAHAGARENKERAAKKACLSGDYAQGVSILSDLYVDTNDPNYIFNQGRCFEQAGRCEEAIIRFREYLRKKVDSGAAADPVAERHIAECQALIGKQAVQPAQAVKPATEAPPAAPEPVTPISSPAPEVKPPVTAQPEPVAMPQPDITEAKPASTAPGAGLRIAGITTMAVGVAGIATGVLLNLKANSLASNLESSTTSYSRSKESTRASYATFAWVGYGVGAACIAGGAVLYYLGHSQGQTSQVAFAPVVGPGQVGAALQGAF